MIVHHLEPVFRPPSEWDSLIIQVTEGCTWNRCHFCDMYRGKDFRIKPMTELARELETHVRRHDPREVRRIFLADGNAMVLSMDALRERLDLLRRTFPALRRVSAYASPSDLKPKTDGELYELRSLGLIRLYTGIESGDDEVLARNNKGETAASTLSALLRAREAGMELSVMILLGLGGRERSRDHVDASAHLINRLQPYQLSLLVLGYPFGLDAYQNRLKTPFTPLSLGELILEMGAMVSGLSLPRTHFRCDHSSNFLPLQGVLDRDKGKILDMIHHFSGRIRPSDEPYFPIVG